jgi:hypothetical protein
MWWWEAVLVLRLGGKGLRRSRQTLKRRGRVGGRSCEIPVAVVLCEGNGNEHSLAVPVTEGKGGPHPRMSTLSMFRWATTFYFYFYLNLLLFRVAATRYGAVTCYLTTTAAKNSYLLPARPPIQAPAIHVCHVLQPARGRPAHK